MFSGDSKTVVVDKLPIVSQRASLADIGSKCRALIVEDNAVNQLVLRHMPNRMGVKTTVVANGQEAVDLFTAGDHFSVVLMDCQMPVVDG